MIYVQIKNNLGVLVGFVQLTFFIEKKRNMPKKFDLQYVIQDTN